MSIESLQNVVQEQFELTQKNLNGSYDSFSNVIRRQEFERFLQLGIPTTKNEEWKYTNVFPFLRSDFSFPEQLELSNDFRIFIESTIQKVNPSFALVLVNGKISNGFSLNLDEYLGTIQDIDSYAKSNKEDFEKQFNSLCTDKNSAFSSLSTAFSQNGFVISFVKNVQISEPLYILNFIDSSTVSTIVPTRFLISASKFSKATIIEQSLTFGENQSIYIPTSEVFVDNQANISIVKIQNDKPNSMVVDSMYLHQNESSNASVCTISYGSSLIRNNHESIHNGPNIHTNLFGLAFAKNKQLIDNHTVVDHASAHCSSTELYKHILTDNSTVVFNGKVFVRDQAQKTNAYQSNKTILLSDNATINSKPQLEIFADDVKCSHGATCGGVDEDALFYLRSRGISSKDALSLLTYAFAEEILENVPVQSLKESIENDIRSFLSNKTDK